MLRIWLVFRARLGVTTGDAGRTVSTMSQREPDNLSECDVLRCTARMNGVLVTTSSGRRIEWRTCDDHGERIQSGENYRFDLENNPRVLLMGLDLAGLHQWQVTTMSVAYDVNSPDARMTLTTKRLGADATDEVSVYLDHGRRKQLAQFLAHGDDDEDEGPTYQVIS